MYDEKQVKRRRDVDHFISLLEALCGYFCFFMYDEKQVKKRRDVVHFISLLHAFCFWTFYREEIVLSKAPLQNTPRNLCE
jgi:hypothetical protein